MPIGRYENVTKISGGRVYATSFGMNRIRRAVAARRIEVREHVLEERERLDIIAGREYGNGKLWWVIAAASGIGWGLQVPPGTLILIPTKLSQVRALI